MREPKKGHTKERYQRTGKLLLIGRSFPLKQARNILFNLIFLNTENFRYNAEILRQLVSYSDEYTKHNFNDVKLADCILCVGNEKCNICALKTKFQNELKSFRCNDLRRLDDIADFLFHQVDRDEGSTTKRNNFIPQIRLPLSVPVDESDEEFDKSEAASIEQSKAPSALSRLKERFNRRFWGRNIMFAKRM